MAKKKHLLKWQENNLKLLRLKDMLGDAFGSLGGLEQTNHDDGVDVETEDKWKRPAGDET